jgi:diadenosine tetraphosphate (Ap4A) HIT family hydrolase
VEITDILGQKWRVECMGCAIGASTMTPPGGFIAENDSCYMHHDPLVPIEGFLVVASRRHVRSLEELTPEEHADFASLLRLGRQVLCHVADVRAFSLIQEEASSHLHAWFFPWLNRIVEYYGSASLGHIRPAMERAMKTSNTPAQRARVLQWVEHSKELVRLTDPAK